MVLSIWSQIPTSGLVAWYPFNNSLLDSTANNNDLIPALANGGLNYVNGQQGLALNFSQGGNCDVPSAPYITNLNNNSFTVSGWYNLQDSINTTPVVLAVGRNHITNFPTFSIEYFNNGSTGSIAFYTYYDFSYSNLQLTSIDITSMLGNWHHFAFSYEGGDSVKAYIDGLIQPAFSFATSSDTLNDDFSKLEFGSSATYCNVLGSTDDFLVYNSSLSAVEIAQIFNSSSTMVVEEEMSSSITIFPNPATNIINVNSFTNETIAQVEILSIDGKLINTYNHKNNSIDLSDLHPGVYLVRCNINNHWVVKRIIKN